MENTEDNQIYCRNLVRAEDRERYLTALFAPRAYQRSIWAVLAFNQEVAKIRENVSEDALGEIRIQWWYEALEDILSGNVRHQPVVAELGYLNDKESLWGLLNETLKARQLEMFSGGAADMAALENYAVGLGGGVHELILRICSPKQTSEEAVSAARASGAAWTMLGLLRAIPFQWQGGRSMLPKENDTAMQQRDSDQTFKAVEPTIREMLKFIKERLVEARECAGSIPKSARVSLLCCPLAQMHIEALEKAGNNPFEVPPFAVSDLRKITKLYWSNLTGRL